QIMAENGKDIEREKQKTLTAQEAAKDVAAQLEKANKTLEGFKDYEETKATLEKYKAETETAKKEAAAKIASLERSAQVKDFLSGKKFVNDITRDALAAKLTEQLGSEEAKGKSLDDLFSTLTKDQKNILADDTAPAPPVQGSMKGTSHAADERATARAVMGLPPEKD
ncbi:MAG: phage scaffolding protein, partial [Treponema sp.]|uniref:phage scaffolding protein n=1 Tax=Treponema sp. TaxID=166 RepID=UPI003FA2DDAE